eukprot:3517362-Alexandrium_andersonii.AAC.1
MGCGENSALMYMGLGSLLPLPAISRSTPVFDRYFAVHRGQDYRCLLARGSASVQPETLPAMAAM